MSTFTDLEKDAASVDGFVNENGLIETRRNGPKPSWQYLVDEVRNSRGFRVVGAFADGFTYELFNDVGLDADGNSWIYVGEGAPNKVVAAGTVPSVSAGYEQVTFNDHNNMINRNSEGAHDASAINYSGGGNVDELLIKVENSEYFIQYFGGSDDGVKDNIAAIEAAKTAGVKSLRLTTIKNGVYYFGNISTTLLDDIILSVDDGVVISLQQTDNYELVDKLTLQGIAVIYDRNISRCYKAHSDNLKNLAMPLTNIERDVTQILSSQLYQATGTIGTDGLTTQTFTDTAGYQLTMPSMVANNFAIVAYPCEINERIGFNWSSESYSKGVCVVTENEIYLVYSSSAGANLNLYYKKNGALAVTGTVSKPISSYSLERSQPSIQRLSAKKCRVISNSVSMSGLIPEITMDSDILFVGSVYVSTGTGEAVNVKNFFRETNPVQSNVNYEMSLYGDSLTDVYANNWPELTKSILQSNGHSVSVNNFAVAGENSTQQMARFTSNGLGNARIYGFILGTNDVQGSIPLTTTLSNLDSFCTTVINAGRKVFVGIPPVWMTQSMGGGTGYVTSNYDKAADYRGSIMRYCQDRGIEYFEMSACFSYVNDATNEFIRDNIHQTDIGYASTAVAAASSVMNILRPNKFKRSYRKVTPIGGVSLWSGLELKVALNRDKDQVSFAGLLDVGGLTLTDGASLFSLSKRYIPQKDKYIVISNNYAANTHIRIDSSNGVVAIYGAGTTPATAWLSLDGAVYDLFN